MPEPRRRSRSLKRTFVKTPGGRTLIHYKKKRHKPARCGVCGAKLSGTPTGPKIFIKKLPKSRRRPNRPYGGNLCPKCTRRIFLRKAMEISL